MKKIKFGDLRRPRGFTATGSMVSRRVFQTLACVSAIHAVLAMQQNEPAACDTDIIELTGLGKIKGAVAGAVRYFRGVPYVCSRFLFC